METKLEKIDKTFDQRQFDYSTPQNGSSVSWGSAYDANMSTLCTTIQSTAGPGGTSTVEDGTVRIGDKITLSSLSIKGELVGPPSGNESNNRVRLMLVRFKEDDLNYNAAQLVAAVLQNYPTAVGSAMSYEGAIYSPYKNVITQINSQVLQKYEVLYDKTFELQQENSGSVPISGQNNKHSYRHRFSISKKWKKGLVIQYSKPLDSRPSLNSIHLLALSDSSVPDHPTVRFASRFKYMDA